MSQTPYSVFVFKTCFCSSILNFSFITAHRNVYESRVADRCTRAVVGVNEYADQPECTDTSALMAIGLVE